MAKSNTKKIAPSYEARMDAIELRTKPATIIPEFTTVGEALAAWDDWCQRFSKLPQEPMTEKVARSAVSIFLMEAQNVPFDEGDIGKVFFADLAKRRFTYFGVPVSDYLLMLIAAISRNPAAAVMYVHLMIWHYLQDPHPLKTEDLVNFFPMGFPMEESIHDIWYMQKLPGKLPVGGWSDNFLDNISKEALDVYPQWLEAGKPTTTTTTTDADAA